MERPETTVLVAVAQRRPVLVGGTTTGWRALTDELADRAPSLLQNNANLSLTHGGLMTSQSNTHENSGTHAVPPIFDDVRRTAHRGVIPRRPSHRRGAAPPIAVTIDDARLIAATLPRSYEALVRDQLKLRVGRLVYAAFYHDDTIMGFGFPRDEREALVASEPDKFLMPRPSEMRYQWVCVQLSAIDVDELRELLVDAWRMCVPKKVAAAYEG
jgi:hypothetical protein